MKEMSLCVSFRLGPSVLKSEYSGNMRRPSQVKSNLFNVGCNNIHSTQAPGSFFLPTNIYEISQKQ